MNGPPSRIERQAYTWLMKMQDDPGRHAAALDHWLAKDPEHRAVYDRAAKEVRKASGSAARIPSLRAVSQPAPRSVSWHIKAGMVTIGALILIGAAVWGALGGSYLNWRDRDRQETQVAEARTLTATKDGRVVELADGSRVTLFADSQIATRFTQSERSIDLLQGTARFAVAHNSARPFVVYAAGGKVTATGTLFEVAIADGVKVHLISGSVEVSLPPRAAGLKPRRVRLEPGQMLSYPRSQPVAAQLGTQGAAPAPPPALETFDDVPASDIAEKVNRSSPIKIAFAKPSDGSRKVVASITITDAEDAAQKLATLLGLVIDRSQPDRLLLKHPY